MKSIFNKISRLRIELKSAAVRYSTVTPINANVSNRIDGDLDHHLESRTSPSPRSTPAAAVSWCASLSDIEKTCQSTLLRLNDLVTIQQLCDGDFKFEFRQVNPKEFFRKFFSRYDSILRRKSAALQLNLGGEYQNCFVLIDEELTSKAIDSIVGTSFENNLMDNSLQVKRTLRFGSIILLHKLEFRIKILLIIY